MNDTPGQVILADADKSAPGRRFADRFVHAPIAAAQDYEAWFMDLMAEHTIALALSVNDYELSRWSAMALAGETAESVIRLSATTQASLEDKWTMWEWSKDTELPVPKTFLANDYARDTLPDDLVVKARFGSGSNGLQLCSKFDVEFAIAAAASTVTDNQGTMPADHDSRHSMVILQERIRGQEYGMDVVCDMDGRFVTVLPRKKIRMRNGETDKAITVDKEPFLDLGLDIARAVRHRGSVDVDVMLDENAQPWLIDINPRFGGGYPFSHLAGAHLPAALVAWRHGQPAQDEWLTTRSDVLSAKYVDTAVTGDRL